MKAYFRYQKGYLYEEHGAWYVRYRQRAPQEDGSSAERARRRLSEALWALGQRAAGANPEPQEG